MDKLQLKEQGYMLLRQAVQKIIDTVEADSYLIDDNENIFIKRESGKILKMFAEHDLWKAGL